VTNIECRQLVEYLGKSLDYRIGKHFTSDICHRYNTVDNLSL